METEEERICCKLLPQNAGATDLVDVSVTVNLANPGSSDADWAATYTFTVDDCLLV